MFEFEVVYYIPKLVTAVFLITAIITTVLSSVYIFNSFENRYVLYRVLPVQFIILIFQLGQFMSMVSPPKEYVFFIGMSCIGMCFLGQGILNMSGVFSSGHSRYEWRTVAAFSISLMGIVLLATNESHNLFYVTEGLYNTKFNIAFWGLTFYSLFCLILIGKKCLFSKRVINNKHNKLQRTLIIAGIMSIVLTAVIDSKNLLDTDFLIMPSSIMITQLTFLSAYYVVTVDLKALAVKSNLLGIIDETVIIADLNGKILYHNDSRLIEIFDNRKHGHIGEMLKSIQNSSKEDISKNIIMNNINGVSDSEVIKEIELRIPEHTYIRLTLNPLKRGSGQRIGSLLTLRDVSEYSNIIREMDYNNSRLFENNHKLEKYAIARRRLASENERKRIISSINHTIGYSLKEITDILKSVENDNSDHMEVKDKIIKGVELSRRTIEKVRESVDEYADDSDLRKGSISNDKSTDCR